jgi:hypothetical protein
MIIGGVKTRAHVSEKFVETRRNVEQNVNMLGAYLKSDMISRHVASWEATGKEKQRNRFQRGKIEELKKNFERQTNDRREKLKSLYDQEEYMYTQELRGLRPTAEQIKQGMISKVSELKEKRETMRLQEVEEKLDRRFKEGADELRLVDSKIREMKTKHEQDIQMLEKQRKMEQEYVEEMIYAELWRRDVGQC